MKWYSIYKNINQAEFTELKSRLDLIERIVSPIMQTERFCLNRISYDEVLSLDYIKESKPVYGNIGLKYDEGKSAESRFFVFYILKSYDKKGVRHYKREELNQVFTLSEIENRCTDLFSKCLSIFLNYKMEDLSESIQLKKRH